MTDHDGGNGDQKKPFEGQAVALHGPLTEAERKEVERIQREQEHRARDDSFKERQTAIAERQLKTNSKLTTYTLLLVALGLLGSAIAFWAANAAKESAEAARRAAETAEKTLALMKTGGEETSVQVDRLIEQQRSTATSMVTSLRLARENFVRDQRPYIFIANSKTTSTIEFHVGQRVRWDIQFVNYGRSPALDSVTVAHLWLGRESMNEVGKFFQTLGTMAPGRGHSVVPPVIGDGGAQTPGFQYSSVLSDRTVISDDKNYIDQYGGAVLAGRTWYKDVFGNSYYTDFCKLTLGTGAISDCLDHNRIH